MTEYKQWYEEDGFTLHIQDRVYYTQCGPSKAYTLFELLKKTTDVSTEDFRQRGMSMDFLKEKGFARVVSRSSFRVHRMPARDERIEIITAEEKPENLQIVQTYEFLSESGEPLISGESAWMFIDYSTRRIIPTKNFTLRTPPTERKTHDCLPYGRIKRPEGLSKLAEIAIKASALDGNGHVDNAWYAAFIEDALPSSYASRSIKDFRINYSKELYLGDNLIIEASFEDNGNKVTIIGTKVAGDTQKAELSFESELYWA